MGNGREISRKNEKCLQGTGLQAQWWGLVNEIRDLKKPLAQVVILDVAGSNPVTRPILSMTWQNRRLPLSKMSALCPHSGGAHDGYRV